MGNVREANEAKRFSWQFRQIFRGIEPIFTLHTAAKWQRFNRSGGHIAQPHQRASGETESDRIEMSRVQAR